MEKVAVMDGLAFSTAVAFFERSGLKLQDLIECHVFLESHFPGIAAEPVPQQGFCSYTIYLGNDRIIQFRPDNYQLDLTVIEAAQKAFGAYVPPTKYLGKSSGLHIYLMGKISGISYQSFREKHFPNAHLFRQRMCEDFALLLGRSWHHGRENVPKGVVGSSLEARLQMLSTELPVRFRPIAKHLLSRLNLIESLPWVIQHGDLIASNIMSDPSTGHLSGLVDWAEAEILPFGICLYGLEEFLGEMTSRGFFYCPNATLLREVFWKTLLEHIPELQCNLTAVSMARDLGVLLWHGIAFDDGKIDRVVQEGRDDVEIAYLDAFLGPLTEKVPELSISQTEWILDSEVVVA